MKGTNRNARAATSGLHSIAAVLLLVSAWIPSAIGAQLVRGTVRDGATGAPIVGAVVSVATTYDSLLTRTITDNLGAFALRVGGFRSTHLRVVRLGYQPEIMAHELVDSGAMDITLVAIAWGLAPVHSETRSDCPERKDAAAAAELWTQAQASLLAGIVARDANPAVMRVIRFHREVTDGKVVPIVGQTVQTITGVGTRVVSAGQTPSYFEAHGYTGSQPLGDVVYTPDDEVLVDGSFARTHCFGIDRDRDHHPGELGITFVPTGARDALTDIMGTLWVDSTRAQLRRLQFTYTHFPGISVYPGAARGSITFETSANGTPLIVAWLLRLPPTASVGQFQETFGGYGRGYGVVLRPIPEQGGELVRATWADGTTWVSPLDTLGRVNGIVRDLTTHLPRPNVPVSLLNAARSVRTDSLGRFAFDELLPGPYVLAIDDTILALFREVVGADEPRFAGTKPARSMLDWLASRFGHRRTQGAPPQLQTIGIDRGQNPDITIEIPALDRAFRSKCGGAVDVDSVGIIAAWALRGDTPQDGATIRARWTRDGAEIERSVRTDEVGRAMICGVPQGKPVSLRVAIEGRTSADSTIVHLNNTLVTFTVIRVGVP
jgi:hypothetical protein